MKRVSLPKRKVLSMLKKGDSLTDIGKQLGCTRGTVKNRLVEWGISTSFRKQKQRKGKPPYQDKEVLSAAYAETPSTILLGEVYGVGPGAIRAWLHRHQIPVTYKRVVSNADYSKPWTNKAKLARAYEKKGAKALAKQWGCSAATIFNWLKRFEIPVRAPTSEGVSYESSYEPLRKKRNKKRRSLPGREAAELKEKIGSCQRCGYDKHFELLEVHHFDRDRCNNRQSNLAVLCVMCHALDSRKVKRISKIEKDWYCKR